MIKEKKCKKNIDKIHQELNGLNNKEKFNILVLFLY